MTVRVWVGLGSNLDNPRAHVMRAFDDLDVLPRTRLLRRSALYQSEPWGYTKQPDFINAVAELETTLAPRALLSALRAIERGHGRDRQAKQPRFGPRLLDLDLLLIEGQRCNESDLVVPHPRMAERAFVLMPLAELAPELEIPEHGTVAEMLARIDQTSCLRCPSDTR